MSAARLKDELKKRGRGTFGNKAALQGCLKEAIALNMPVAAVSGGGKARHHNCMVGLDVTAKWELLTWCDDPIPKPNNYNRSLWPSTEMNAAINPKYGFIETFDCIPFTRTTKKMQYCRPDRQPVNCLRKEKRKMLHLDTQHSHPVLNVQPRKLGIPNTNFLNWYKLDKTSHPMDWFTALMLLTLNNNKEDPSMVNVKGDCGNIRNGYLYGGDLLFVILKGIYGFKFPKRFLEISYIDLTSLFFS